MLRKFLLGVSAAVVMSGTAHAASIITNGSFEQGSYVPSSPAFNTLGTGSGAITGWDVTSGSVDWVNQGYWDAQDGDFSVDLAGGVPGSIAQTFATVAGTLYTVTYWVSGNPDGGDFHKDFVVAAINGSQVLASSSNHGDKAPGHRDMQYYENTFQFTAQGASTTLSFASGSDEGAYGAVLDNVTVTSAVPEPTTWAMMLVGFGVVGASMRRRAKRHPLQLA